jgi:hypothetical protein
LTFDQDGKEDAVLQRGTARKVLSGTDHRSPVEATEDRSPGSESKLQIGFKRPFLRSSSVPSTVTGWTKSIVAIPGVTRSRTNDEEAQIQHHHEADTSSNIRSGLAGNVAQGKASALDDKLANSLWNTSVLDSPWHSRTHMLRSTVMGFCPTFVNM